ncbi:MAG TPA: pirin family protein [Methanocorpusculum sp.]|nr:pirin family protein [Methanocorpusculum sp.]
MSPIFSIDKLGFPFQTENPFLFCAHHKDAYPKGEKDLGPAASLAGRNLGNDFTVRNGYRMYHGHRVPGFPEHPHCGFETVTVTLRGYVDHSDSLGSAGRYGNGDVQWMTAGSGCQHAEMFPLIHQDTENPLELFQIWLNLPRKDKFTEPAYTMFWSEEIPGVITADARGNECIVRVIAGSFQGMQAPKPPAASWAADAAHHVRILVIRMNPDAELLLPGVSESLSRSLYFYDGDEITVGGSRVAPYHRIRLAGDADVTIKAGSGRCFLLLLEGEPISEPVVQYRSFVMNSEREIQEAFRDYQRTGFGGWPWSVPDPVHDTGTVRFARYADGTTEQRDPNLPVQ